MYIFKKIIASALALTVAASCAASAFALEQSKNVEKYGIYGSVKLNAKEESSYIEISDDCEITISQDGHTQDATKFHTTYDYYLFRGDYTNKHKLVISEETTRDINIILDGYKFISDSAEPMWQFNGKGIVNIYLINGTENTLTSNSSAACDMIKTADGCTLNIFTFTDNITVPNDTDTSLPYINTINDFGNGEKAIFKLTSNADTFSAEEEAPSIIRADKINFTGNFEMDLNSKNTAALNAKIVNVYNDPVIKINSDVNRKLVVHNFRQSGGEVLFEGENSGTLMYLDGEWSNFMLTRGKFEGKTDGYVVEGDVVNQFSITGGSVRMESTSKAIVYARRKLQDFYIENGNVSMITTAPAAVECQKPYFIPFSNGKAVIINGGNVHIVAAQCAFASTVKENGSVTYEKMDVYNLFGDLVYQHRIDFENDKGVSFIGENVKETDLGYVLYNDRLMTSGSKLDLDHDYVDNGIYMWLNEPKENENGCLVFAGEDTSYTFKHVGSLADYMADIDTVPAVMKYDNSSLYVIFDRNGGLGGVDSITQISDNKLPKRLKLLQVKSTTNL